MQGVRFWAMLLIYCSQLFSSTLMIIKEAVHIFRSSLQRIKALESWETKGQNHVKQIKRVQNFCILQTFVGCCLSDQDFLSAFLRGLQLPTLKFESYQQETLGFNICHIWNDKLTQCPYLITQWEKIVISSMICLIHSFLLSWKAFS